MKKVCGCGIIHPNKENILTKYYTKEYLQTQHKIILIAKINIIYVIGLS
jgi:hypothetical protein